MINSLVLVEGDKVIGENLMIPITDAEEFLIGSADGFGQLLQITAETTAALGVVLRRLATEVPNVTGVISLGVRQTA